ncbi:MAG: IS701 family transposase [Candidatus Jordarchaeaceae archaeon]
MATKNEKQKKDDLLNPQRWGIPVEETPKLGSTLHHFWTHFQARFKTKTRDASKQAQIYLRGLLTMEGKRNYANIARKINGPEEDGQKLQHFVSDSPWPTHPVFEQIQAEVGQQPELQGGMLTLDESGNKKSGDKSAGTARQYIGRLGKVDLGQVGVILGYCKTDIWLIVDAELYLPQKWFNQEHALLRRRYHIPEERNFKTKQEIGLEMILQAKAKGLLSFQVVGCDTFYGRDASFRAELDAQKVLYLAEIPSNTLVYLEPPIVGIPEKQQRGRKPTRPHVLNGVTPVRVRDLVQSLKWREVIIRPTERGTLSYRCAATRVWTVDKEGRVREEWLLVREEKKGEEGEEKEEYSYSLSNAPPETPLDTLALWRSMRYFAERTFQDAKSELGWGDLMARKYRAWMHHTALTALALWFIGYTKLDWARRYPQDPDLVRQLEVEVLPALSVANVREMLRATLPLKQLSPEEAVRLVNRHLLRRARSTRSRLKNQRGGQRSQS